MNHFCNTQSIIIFLKAPIKGLVKTRLAITTGNEHALEIYKLFVTDIIKTVTKKSPFTLCFYPEEKRGELVKWLGDSHMLTAQKGEDLGERMKNAFMEAFSGGKERVVIMGTDVPDLPGTVLTEAFRSLDDNDAVIGPSPDGGYYLIGFRRDTFTPAAFENIAWSTETVFEKTTAVFKKKSLSYHLLPSWNDIDTWQDFTDFLTRNSDNPEFITKYQKHPGT